MTCGRGNWVRTHRTLPPTISDDLLLECFLSVSSFIFTNVTLVSRYTEHNCTPSVVRVSRWKLKVDIFVFPIDGVRERGNTNSEIFGLTRPEIEF